MFSAEHINLLISVNEKQPFFVTLSWFMFCMYNPTVTCTHVFMYWFAGFLKLHTGEVKYLTNAAAKWVPSFKPMTNQWLKSIFLDGDTHCVM